MNKKQAILITAYKNFEYLYNLTEKLICNFDVYIHIDKKAHNRKFVIEKLQSIGCVAFSSYSINWGAYNHVRAIIKLLKISSMNDYSYYHIISGEDIPIKPFSYFIDFFNENNKIYIEYDRSEQWESRYKWYYPFVNMNARSLIYRKILNPISLCLQKALKVNRKRIGEFNQIYKGLAYCSLPYDAVSYMLNYIKCNKKFLFSLAQTYIPEEFFFQTIFLNSPLKERVAKKCLRYSVWEVKNGSNPGYLDDDDIPAIMNSDCVFARKVNYQYSSNLIDRFLNLYNMTDN